MLAYELHHWMFLWLFYCFFGWCFESTYVSLCEKKLVNRGFLRGPVLPLYGCGAVVMLWSSYPVRDNLFLTFLFGMIAATVLEYVTGVLMESIFKVRYWDYSDQKLQFQGHICLSSSIAWGGLTVFLTRVLHPLVERMMYAIPELVLGPLVNIITFIGLIDLTLSVRAALDIRDAMVYLAQAKRELERIKKRIDVLVAFAAEDSARELQELKERLISIRARREHAGKLRGFYQKYLFRNNPTMKSRKFADAFEQLKLSANERRKKKQKED